MTIDEKRATERDAQILAEAQKQREHNERIAKIDAQTTIERERQLTLRRESRYQMFGWVAGISGAVAVVLTIIISISNATSDDRAKELKLREQQNQVAETCMREGNIWINGNCIPAKK